MKTYLVTGGAGFIGSNFVLYMLKKYEDIRIINLDKLTYAGNLENLKSIQDDPRHIFVHGDICDNELVKSLFEKYKKWEKIYGYFCKKDVKLFLKSTEIFRFIYRMILQNNTENLSMADSLYLLCIFYFHRFLTILRGNIFRMHLLP